MSKFLALLRKLFFRAPTQFSEQRRHALAGASVLAGLGVSAAQAQISLGPGISITGQGGGGGTGTPSGFTTITQFGAIANNASFDNSPAILTALGSGAQTIWVPPGTWYCLSRIIFPTTNLELRGFGMDVSTIVFQNHVTGLNLRSFCSVSDLTLEGSTPIDDVNGNAGIVFGGTVDEFPGNNCQITNVKCIHWGFHGFASGNQTEDSGTQNTQIIGCWAEDCGHRGINLSAGSRHNLISDFTAKDCARAGIILGHKTRENVIDNVYVDGYRSAKGGAGIWLVGNCDHNAISNVVIGPQNPEGNTAVGLIVESYCSRNTFSNFVMTGQGIRAIYLFNNLDVIPVDLGEVPGDLRDNIFDGFAIEGTNVASSAAIWLNEDVLGGASAVDTVTLTNAGSGYTGTGTYYNVPTTGGTGTGCLVNVVVAADGTVSATLTTAPPVRGTGYLVGDTLSVDNANIGGAGSGFLLTVATITDDVPSFQITGNIFNNFTIKDFETGLNNASIHYHLVGRNVFRNFRFDNVTNATDSTIIGDRQYIVNFGDPVTPQVDLINLSTFGNNGVAIPLLTNQNPVVQVAETNFAAGAGNFAVSANRFKADSTGASFCFVKSRGATYGDIVPPITSDSLGQIRWFTNDGIQFLSAASITALADAAQTTASFPTRLSFNIVQTGTPTVLSEALRITSTGGIVAAGGVRIWDATGHICTKTYATAAALPAAASTGAARVAYLNDGGASKTKTDMYLVVCNGTHWYFMDGTQAD